MKQQKFVFYRYSFQEDPDTIPEKRVAEEKGCCKKKMQRKQRLCNPGLPDG